MDAYKKYEKDCKRIRDVNGGLLADFEASLKSGLGAKTIEKHVSNIDFYINEYLLYEDAIEAKDGVHSVGMFLGYWFIRKTSWASQANIKSSAASIKKFYAFMVARGFVHQQELDILEAAIKEEMPDWLAAVKRFDAAAYDLDDY